MNKIKNRKETKIKKIISFLLVLSLLTVLCSCSNQITQGEVYNKEFHPAEIQTTIVPIVRTDGKTTHTTLIPFIYYYPDRWKINIKQLSEDGETLTATYWVSKEVFDALNIGDEFVYNESRDLSEEPYTRERE